jgi:hypothetical protein
MASKRTKKGKRGRTRGFYITPNVVMDTYGRQISDKAWKVYCSLRRHANRSGTCFPSYQHIADTWGMSRRTVIREMKLLLRLGLVSAKPGYYRGKVSSNSYFLPTPCSDTRVTPKGDSRGDTRVTRGVTSVSPLGVTPVSPKQYPYEQDPKNNTPHTPQGGAGAFEQFWEAYPLKDHYHEDALRAWKKLKLTEKELPEIIAYLERKKSSAAWTRENGRAIPAPHRWLAGRPWVNDKPKASKTRAQREAETIARREQAAAEREAAKRSGPRQSFAEALKSSNGKE